jgi:hypothetical protein
MNRPCAYVLKKEKTIGTLHDAIVKQDLTMVKYFLSRGSIILVAAFCEMAASKGDLKVLKELRKKNCPWDESTCESAALGGYINCLEFAHKNGCPWDENTPANAAKNRHLNCLKFALNKQCPHDGRIYSIQRDLITPTVISIGLEYYDGSKLFASDDDKESFIKLSNHYSCLKFVFEHTGDSYVQTREFELYLRYVELFNGDDNSNTPIVLTPCGKIMVGTTV